MGKISKIQIEVHLDDLNVPEKVLWTAQDSDSDSPTEAKGLLISIFEKSSLDTLKLDIWTKEMQVIEMDRFMYQTLNALCDSYLKATNNVQLSNEFKSFVTHFGKSTEIVP
ncbi:MAG: gliding motility protein GldC [Saprospiraceae bacterium]|nr:gliding motility protein GldC [Saprospiraceae bacterium]